MTPQKFLKLRRPINSEYQLEKLIREYAILMCQKQKEICAEEAEVSGGLDEGFRVDPDSILSSPLPKELQDAEN